MDEMMEVMPEGTTPMEETNVELTESEVEEPAAAPQAEEKPTEESTVETETKEPQFTITYNHEDVVVSMEEGKRLAQYGLFMDKLDKEYSANIKEIIKDLDYYATIQNKSANEVVKELVNGIEESYRNELVEKFGEDAEIVDEMVELRRNKNNKFYEAAISDRATRNKQAQEEAQKTVFERLAGQFEELRELFPDIDTIEKIPDAVLKKAAESGDLEKEMLRYEKSERTKIEAAKASQEKNKKENIGSVQSTETESGTISAFMSGLWG